MDWLIALAASLFGTYCLWAEVRQQRRRSRPPTVQDLERVRRMQVGAEREIAAMQAYLDGLREEERRLTLALPAEEPGGTGSEVSAT